jgi:hypothetical protein
VEQEIHRLLGDDPLTVDVDAIATRVGLRT